MARLKGSRISSFRNKVNSKSKSKSNSKREKGQQDQSGTRSTGVLEIEMESFLPNKGSRNKSNKNRDKDEQDANNNGDDSMTSSGISNNQKKVILLMLVLASFVGMYIIETRGVIVGTRGVDGRPIGVDSVELKPPTASFHSPGGSFGGVNNIAHPAGAKAASKGEGIAFEEIVIPKSNVGHAIPSLNRPNIVNSWGHYVHDEHRSPYASHLYSATKEELEERQQKYLEKMKKVREEWGAWDFRDPRHEQGAGAAGEIKTTTTKDDNDERSATDFSNAEYKDLPVDEFPPDAWQSDEEYVGKFLEEGKKLIHRVKEGIYAEYGWPSKGKDETYLKQRAESWKIHRWDPSKCLSEDGLTKIICTASTAKVGIATMQTVAFDGLVRKLLHALMTNDEFYAVLGGHSAAAGHGNDFQQNRIMTFHHLMEPIFDKLGMRLVSRNMGMGGVGTLQFTLAGGDLYGETDILEWDSGMTEKGPAVDLFNKQAILSGERVPIILTDFPFDVMKETNGTAWMGNYIRGGEKNIIPDTTFENAASQPYAARWYNQKSEKYNAVCWEPRSDFTPLKVQDAIPKSQVSWHPGNRQHLWSGRKLALILLEALGVAFERWEEGITKEGCPLAASYWHVGESYKIIRENLRTHITTPNKEVGDVRSQCEKLIPWLPRLCRVQMHGFGMWNPRAHVDYDLLNILHPAPNGYKPDFRTTNAYDGFDVMPLNQAVADGDIDVHAIAIATTNPAPDLDHSWIEDSVSDSDSGNLTTSVDAPPPDRRWLRDASELAFRKGAELFPPSTVVKNRISFSKKEGKMEEVIKTSSSSSSDTPLLRRQLDDATTAATSDTTATTTTTDVNAIVPGRGWELHGWGPVKGFCDGSAQSECARNEENQCMIVGANDKHYDVWGDSLSGWLVFTVPKVREGIILVRMEWWCGGAGSDLTRGWTEVNDGKTTDTTPWNPTDDRRQTGEEVVEEEEQQQRKLKVSVDGLVPKDFEMDWAINGVVKTMLRDEWVSHVNEFVKNVAVWPLLDDASMAQKDWDGEPVEVAIRFRSKINPHIPYCISHVYYA